MFHSNSAKDYESFLFVNESSKIMINDKMHFICNMAESGGALLVYNSTVNLNNKTKTCAYFTRNSVAGNDGAIALKNQSMLIGSVERIVFRDNTASQYGGAVYVHKLLAFVSIDQNMENSSFNLMQQKVGGRGRAIILKESEKSQLNVSTPKNDCI